jgi:lactate dehydrogenase-like 2-hydroxyacid dehydrogenase
LEKVLSNDYLSGAAIDVYPVEPEKNGDKFKTPLQNLSNVILTLHIFVRQKNHEKIISMGVIYIVDAGLYKQYVGRR